MGIPDPFALAPGIKLLLVETASPLQLAHPIDPVAKFGNLGRHAFVMPAIHGDGAIVIPSRVPKDPPKADT